MTFESVKVLVADPPWLFGDALGGTRGASRNYDCLTTSDIRSFPLPPLADDAVLFLWRVAAMQQEALDVVTDWGFALKSELVWEKLTVTGKQHFGMGRTVRASHEVCLIATRGRPIVKSHSIRSVFRAQTGIHSRKPDEFFRIVESLFDGPYAELFARVPRVGWRQQGRELRA